MLLALLPLLLLRGLLLRGLRGTGQRPLSGGPILPLRKLLLGLRSVRLPRRVPRTLPYG